MAKRAEQKQAPQTSGKVDAPGRWAGLNLSAKGLLIVSGGAILLVALVFWFFFGSPRKETPPGMRPQSGVPSTATVQGQAAPAASSQATAAARPSIQSIRFHPRQPTKMDILKVEIAATAPHGEISYTYQWKVNDRVLKEVAGDTLNLSALKKRDLISVTVTPHADDVTGFAVESPIVAVHSAPPSLELKAMERQARKVGDPIELQLIGYDPDGDTVRFSLETPLVSGMSIDGQTGKITWTIQPNQKGIIRFGAAVEDTDKNKITKTFEISVE